ncbi:MAG: gamma-glutamyl-gamma-aminobutyrate hydrolase family protein [Ktedonobacteraceae bacterium]
MDGQSGRRARPRIGILSSGGCLREGGWPVYAGDAATVNAVFEAGGYPIIIPVLPLAQGYDPFNILADDDAFEEVFAIVWQTIRDLDGILLAGGGDVYACLYGQEMHPQAGAPEGWRDLWERYFALAAWHLALPTLGICRGMQVMNIALGGGLIQDVQAAWPRFMPPLLSHRAPGRIRVGHWANHAVRLSPKSLLAAMLRDPGAAAPGRQHIEAVLSMHHQIVGYVTPEAQIVGNLAPHLLVSATAPDGVIEGIEADDSRRYWLGVQFHPEWQAADWTRRLFQSLVAARRPFHLHDEQVRQLGERIREADRRFQPRPAVSAPPDRRSFAVTQKEMVYEEVPLP